VQQQRGSRKSKKDTPSTPVSSKKGGKGVATAAAALEPKVALFEGAQWTKDEKYDPEINLDSGYRRHVTRHCNKVLLRIRMLHYIKQEIIRDLEAQVNAGVNAAMLPIQPPFCEQSPTPWWDAQADVSLLVGTYKHGYERYAVMRLDPSLCFLVRCGPPDKQELLSEMASLEANGDELDKAPDEDEDMDDDSSSTTQGAQANHKSAQAATPASNGKLLHSLSIFFFILAVLIVYIL
jgi:chromodomain-helicase-DNA-binding protein 7